MLFEETKLKKIRVRFYSFCHVKKRNTDILIFYRSHMEYVEVLTNKSRCVSFSSRSTINDIFWTLSSEISVWVAVWFWFFVKNISSLKLKSHIIDWDELSAISHRSLAAAMLGSCGSLSLSSLPSFWTRQIYLRLRKCP